MIHFFLSLVLFSVVHCEEDPDVIVVTVDNFDEFIQNEHALLEFYAPWCGHCKKLAPEYSAAATQLKESGSSVVLGKCDATVHNALAGQFGVRGYPTLKFFRAGVASDYDGGRTTKEIVQWITKKSGPLSVLLDSADAIAEFSKSEGTRGVAFLNEEQVEIWLKAAADSKLSNFFFGHATDESVFGENKPGDIVLNKDGEDPLAYDGEFNVGDVVSFFASEGFPLVEELSQDSWTRAQGSQTDLLAVFGGAPGAALSVAKANKGSLVVTSSDNIQIASRWGASGEVVPTAVYVSNSAEQPEFTIWNEETEGEMNSDTLSAFVESAKSGTYKPFLKSEPIPENNDGPVAVVVRKSFEDVVYQAKDVLVEFYAPWCGHCKKLAPIYEELGQTYSADENVVIAKMDATANGSVEGVSVSGFPTLIFFDSNNKQVPYDGERDLDSFVAWIEKNRSSSASKEDL